MSRHGIQPDRAAADVLEQLSNVLGIQVASVEKRRSVSDALEVYVTTAAN